jgi:ribonuclease HII
MPAAPPRTRKPSLRVERALQRAGHRVVDGLDEVGRVALAGAVSVGVVLIDETCRSAPVGVRDSKLLTPAARQAMVPKIQRWCLGYAVGHASADEIDRIGIMAALRLAGMRALEAVRIEPDLVILDGNHDWLTAPEEVGLFAFAGSGPATPPVTTMIKADLTCSSVAAASVLAKVERDGIMVEAAREHPTYGWAENKGYAAPEHVAALEAEGPCVLHRRSWRLPGTMVEDGVGEAVEPDLRDGTPAEVLDDELAEVRYEALDETLGEGRHRGALDERDAG